MTVNASLPPTQAQRIVPGSPFRILCLCRGSLATSVPTKVVGLVDRTRWLPELAHGLVGGLRLSAKRPRRRRRE